MKSLFALTLIFISTASFADVKMVEVIAGDKVKIQVMDCKSNEAASFKLNDKSGVVTVSCTKALCQAESKSGKYNVYRFHGQECAFNGCSDKAKIVGTFKADTILGTNISSRSALKRAMISFMSKTEDCGSVRVFINGAYGYLTVQ